MQIARAVAIVVTNDNIASRQGVVADLLHTSISGGHDGRADRHGPVSATMRTDAPRHRVGATRIKTGTHAVAAFKGVAAEGGVETMTIRSVKIVVGAIAQDGQVHPCACILDSQNSGVKAGAVDDVGFEQHLELVATPGITAEIEFFL